MALVGSAHIMVRAFTNGVPRDLQRGFSGARGIGRRAGETMGEAFSRGFQRNMNSNIFRRLSLGLQAMVPGAVAARRAFQSLVSTGYTVGTALSSVLGGVSALIGGLGALAGSAGGAIASLTSLLGVVTAVGIGMRVASMALGGVGRAVGLLNRGTGGGGGGGGGGGSGVAQARAREAALERVEDAERSLALVIERNRESLYEANERVREAQLRLNQAIEEGREEIQQLGFDAEDAALGEQRAAIDLEKARETLARVQDLPPNSRARREAELAYREADLSMRRAIDRNNDLSEEQNRLAEEGIAGTDAYKDAQADLEDAQNERARTVRDGLRDEAEANEALARARRDANRAAEEGASAGGGGGGGGVNPFEGLNQAQIDFAKFIASLKPKFDELKAAAAESFLPLLTIAIQTIVDRAWPTLVTGIRQIGDAMGVASMQLADAITESENLEDLAIVFENSAEVLKELGQVVGNIWDAFLSILVASGPLTERFVSWLEDATGRWADFLDAAEGDGRLEDFFNRSGDIMAQFGRIFNNIWNGFGRVINANFGPGTGGDYLLRWLETATQKFEDLGNTPEKMEDLQGYFLDTSVNAQKVLSSVGALIEELLKLGRNDAIGETFDILAEGAPMIGSILEKSVEAGPELARIVVQLTTIIDKLTDSASIETFFNVLGTVLQFVVDLLENDTVAALINVISQITAVLLALALVGRVGSFGFKIVTGAVIGLFNVLGGGLGAGGAMSGFMTKLEGTGRAGRGAAGALRGLGGFLAGPWGVALVGATLAVEVFSNWLESLQASSEEVNNKLRTASSAAEIFATVGQGRDVAYWQDVTGQLGNLSEVLEASAEQSKNLFARFNSTHFGAFDALRDIGTELTAISQTSLPDAQKAFNLLAAETDGSDKELWRLISSMGPFRDELTRQASALGVSATKSNLMKIATGELGGAAETTEGKVQSLSDQILGFANTELSAREANRAFRESLDRVSEGVDRQRDSYENLHGTTDGFIPSLDTLTAEGRENEAALDAVAQAAKRSAAAAIENGDGNMAARAQIQKGREELIKQLEQFGITGQAAEDYADELGLIPKDVDTKVVLDTSGADGQLSNWLSAKNTSSFLSLPVYLQNDIKNSGYLNNANGGFYSYGSKIKAFARGGIESFAGGGFPTGIYPGGTPIFKFAEPETRWEAFVSGRRGQEDRNLGILNEAARRLGAVPNSGGGATLNMTVVAAPGTDETEIAAIASREIMFNLRKGGT